MRRKGCQCPRPAFWHDPGYHERHTVQGSPEHRAKQHEAALRLHGISEQEFVERRRAEWRLKKRQREQRLRVQRVGTLAANVRHALALERRGLCFYCGEPAPDGHVEHVIPLSRGGAQSVGNTVWACGPCNLGKGSLLLAEWSRRGRPQVMASFS